MSFTDLGLGQALLDAIARSGYTTPTPIQAQAIPAVLEGRDVLAAAQTGSGKTAAFTLPLLERLRRADGQRKARHGAAPRVLVLTPTRELAAQVADSVAEYGHHLPLRCLTIFGGVSPGPQIKALNQGVDILVATPGRLLDHIGQGHVRLDAIEVCVLDEADRMLDMGFIRDIRRILGKLPERRQSLLFSATFSKDIRALAKTFLHDPAEIDVAPKNVAADRINQKFIAVPKHQKRELLSWMIGHHDWRQVLVFTRTKHGANRLCKQLCADGLESAALHGNKSQGARTKALQQFKDGSLRVLVATDIAARGLDIEQLPHVINYELPNVPADYVHRIGRTGRAGLSGEALSLVCREERPLLKDIDKLLGRPVPELKLENYHVAEEKAPAADAEANAKAKKAPPPRRGKPKARPDGEARATPNPGRRKRRRRKQRSA